MKRREEKKTQREWKKRMSKASMDLSMGFVVMLILSIVVFILSLVFLKDFFEDVNLLKLKIDEQTKSQIETMLIGNARVAIPIERKETKPGDPVVFGIGIKNSLVNESFKIDVPISPREGGIFIPADDDSSSYELVCFSTAQDDKCEISRNEAGVQYSGQGYRSAGSSARILEYQIGRNGETTIPINSQDIIQIALNPLNRAPRGHYIVNVEICSGLTTPTRCLTYYDGSIHKLHLIVR